MCKVLYYSNDRRINLVEVYPYKVNAISSLLSKDYLPIDQNKNEFKQLYTNEYARIENVLIKVFDEEADNYIEIIDESKMGTPVPK